MTGEKEVDRLLVQLAKTAARVYGRSVTVVVTVPSNRMSSRSDQVHVKLDDSRLPAVEEDSHQVMDNSIVYPSLGLTQTLRDMRDDMLDRCRLAMEAPVEEVMDE